jgi:hypothetical protein
MSNNQNAFSILSFLNSDSYQVYNRNIAKFLGSVNAAIMLSDLSNRFLYHQGENEIITHEKYGFGWFYYTESKCEERTCLTRREQDSGIKKLIEFGFIEKISFALPAKRHFRIKEEKIYEAFGFSKNDSSLAENAKLECTKTPNWNVQKRQTAHIYKELNEEPYVRTTTTTTPKEVVVVVSSEERFDKLYSYLQKFSLDFAPNWILPRDNIRELIDEFGFEEVAKYSNYMCKSHYKAIKQEKNSYKSNKIKPIDNPFTFLVKACKEKWRILKKQEIT